MRIALTRIVREGRVAGERDWMTFNLSRRLPPRHEWLSAKAIGAAFCKKVRVMRVRASH